MSNECLNQYFTCYFYFAHN